MHCPHSVMAMQTFVSSSTVYGPQGHPEYMCVFTVTDVLGRITL